eukprot:3965914-Alexandrium_andersonii.AAC.1
MQTETEGSRCPEIVNSPAPIRSPLICNPGIPWLLARESPGHGPSWATPTGGKSSIAHARRDLP